MPNRCRHWSRVRHPQKVGFQHFEGAHGEHRALSKGPCVRSSEPRPRTAVACSTTRAWALSFGARVLPQGAATWTRCNAGSLGGPVGWSRIGWRPVSSEGKCGDLGPDAIQAGFLFFLLRVGPGTMSLGEPAQLFRGSICARRWGRGSISQPTAQVMSRPALL